MGKKRRHRFTTGGVEMGRHVTVSAALVAVLLLAGCATTAKYERLLDSWIGRDAAELSSGWGYPGSTITAPNGNTVYVYSREEYVSRPLHQTPRHTTVDRSGDTIHVTTFGGDIYGGETVKLWCKTYFEVDEHNTVIHWHWEGNNCKAR